MLVDRAPSPGLSGDLLPKKGEPGYEKIVQKFRDVRKLYDDDSD